MVEREGWDRPSHIFMRGDDRGQYSSLLFFEPFRFVVSRGGVSTDTYDDVN